MESWGLEWPGGKRLAFYAAGNVEHFHFGEGLGHTPSCATPQPDAKKTVCHCASRQHASTLSICDDCRTVVESDVPDFLKELSSIIGKSGFVPMRHMIEVHRVCAPCGAWRAAA